jgi:hypothetical protein
MYILCLKQPPHPDFWRELLGLSSLGHKVENEDNTSYLPGVHVTDVHAAYRNRSRNQYAQRGREDSSPGDKRNCRPYGTHPLSLPGGACTGTKDRQFLEMSKTGSYILVRLADDLAFRPCLRDITHAKPERSAPGP